MSLVVAGATLDGEPTTLRAEAGTIVALGADVAPQPGDEVLDGTRCALLPGLVNGHTHAGMTLFRGYAGDVALMTWLQDYIWPAEGRLTDDDVYWGTRLACVEMIRTGTVCFWDMYWRPGAVARAVEDAGLRATVGLPLIDGLDPARGKELRADALQSLDELADRHPRVTPSLAPHGIYTVSEESLAWVAEQSEERDVAVQLHFLEVADEIAGLRGRTGERPAAYLDRLGLLTSRLVLSHGVWLTDDDLDLIATRGATIVTNPVSNLKLAVGGIFPYAAARQRGIPIGLGTDGASSNNGLDMIQDVKILALVQKHVQRDPAALSALEAWDVATGALAPRLAQSHLHVGDRADFILVRMDAPELGPDNLLANLVYAASGSVVEATVIDGQVLMRGGVLEGVDEVRARAREAALRLGVVGAS